MAKGDAAFSGSAVLGAGAVGLPAPLPASNEDGMMLLSHRSRFQIVFLHSYSLSSSRTYLSEGGGRQEMKGCKGKTSEFIKRKVLTACVFHLDSGPCVLETKWALACLCLEALVVSQQVLIPATNPNKKCFQVKDRLTRLWDRRHTWVVFIFERYYQNVDR